MSTLTVNVADKKNINATLAFTDAGNWDPSILTNISVLTPVMSHHSSFPHIR